MMPVEEPAAAPPTPQGPTSPKVSSTIPRRPNLESREDFWPPRLPDGGGTGWVLAAYFNTGARMRFREPASYWSQKRLQGVCGGAHL